MNQFSSLYEGSNSITWRRDNRANGMWMRSMKRKRSSDEGWKRFIHFLEEKGISEEKRSSDEGWRRLIQFMKENKNNEKNPKLFKRMVPYDVSLPEKRPFVIPHGRYRKTSSSWYIRNPDSGHFHVY